MTTKEFKELKNRLLEKEGNIEIDKRLMEDLTDNQIKKLYDFYLNTFKLDSELKNKNVDILEKVIDSINEGENGKEEQEPKKVALKKSKKVKKEDSKKEDKKEVKVIIDINKLKRGDRVLVIDEQDNHSVVEIRDVEVNYGILGRDIEDLGNCFSISAKELAQGFYIHGRKQYLVKPYRGWFLIILLFFIIIEYYVNYFSFSKK